jgi:hypothetical protein
MAKIGKSLQDLAIEIERRANAKRDMIAPISKLSVEVEGKDKDRHPVLAIHNGQIQTFPINSIANGQLAEYVGIPKTYYDRMATEAPELLAMSVNRWFKDHTDERRLVRLLDAKNRALLSDKYRSLENEDLAEAVLPVLLDLNLLILSCEITDRRLYIKAVDTSIERDIPTGKHMGDGGHTIFDTVSPGIVVSNSEVGSGRLSVETSIFTRACTNLALFGASFKKHHLGGRAEMSDEVYSLLTDDTKKATDAAVWKQVRDVVRGAFEAARFEASIKKLVTATEAKIEPTAVVEVVERVGRKFSLTEGERKGVLARLIEGGNLSLYGLHAAVTRHSADVEDYDRATEFERLGGEIIDLPASAVRELITVQA